jgi:hypothetical protein
MYEVSNHCGRGPLVRLWSSYSADFEEFTACGVRRIYIGVAANIICRVNKWIGLNH